MKAFTVRNLDRRPKAVLEACDKEGIARVQGRDGRRYTVRPEGGAGQKVPLVRLNAEHRARMKRIFAEPIPEEQLMEVDELNRW
jgi:hypothetical protein